VKPTPESIVSRALAAGTTASGVFIALGFAIYLAHPLGGWIPDVAFTSMKPVELYRLPPLRLLSHPLTYLYLGIFILILTPIGRVSITIILFIREKDRRYVVISMTVLAVLLLSIGLSLFV
jgi:uncharacterized membrane protein